MAQCIVIIFILLSVIIGSNCLIEAAKVDCHPNGRPNKDKCEELGCIWSPVYEKATGPRLIQDHELEFNRSRTADIVHDGLYPGSNIDQSWCFYPDTYIGYKIVDFIDEKRIKLKRVQPSSFAQDFKYITLKIDTYGYDGTILRIKIVSSKERRFRPELPKLHLHRSKVSQFRYAINASNHLIIKRASNNETLFDTDLSKLIFTHKFIQLNTELASPFVFGLGEHYDSFVKIANKYKAYSFYNTDKLPVAGGQRSYGSFPFYINLNKNFDESYGVYLHNSNAMDIIIQADQSITFRPTGGILDFFIFIGPKHSDVIQQFQNLIGKPNLPPIWALGYHLGRRGYQNLADLRQVWERTNASELPFESQWIDFDYLQTGDQFTYDRDDKFAGLPEFIDMIHNQRMHLVPIISPAISFKKQNYRPFTLGEEMNIWIKNATNEKLIGKSWFKMAEVVYPDFTHSKSFDFWSIVIREFHNELKFDGLGLSMNEISNYLDGQVNGCSADNPVEQIPYKPGGFDLQTKSLCLSAKLRAGLEYDTHNLHSHYQSAATYKVLKELKPNERPMILSRASSPGQGHFAGHWSGDVLSTWDYLRWSIPALIEHSMYGFSLVGSDICGFAGNTTEQLCARWSTMGAFYTFVRNNNDANSIEQDPVAMGETVLVATRNALNKRYNLIPYLYTLMHRASRYGEPIIRSVALEFPIQYDTYDNHNCDIFKYEEQFMWGGAFMIAPIVHENSNEKATYLPRGRWFESSISPERDEFIRPKSIYSSGQRHRSSDVSLTDLKLFYRGGHIIPTYPIVKKTIAELVKQPLGLDVALSDESKASGEVYLDDGNNLDKKYTLIKMKFESHKSKETFKLTIDMTHDEAMKAVKFGRIRIMGIFSYLNLVTLNETPIVSENVDNVLIFDLEGRQVRKHKKIEIKFEKAK